MKEDLKLFSEGVLAIFASTILFLLALPLLLILAPFVLIEKLITTKF